MYTRVASGTKNTKITLSTVSQKKTYHLVAFLFEENNSVIQYVCENIGREVWSQLGGLRSK
jgi:hypothetical protein